MMDEVDEQALDVRAILVLIGHDHQPAVSQRPQLFEALVRLLEVQAHDLYYVVDFSVVQNL